MKSKQIEGWRLTRGPNARIGADILLELLKKDKKGDINIHPLLPAYIVSVCGAIESRFNEAYISYFCRRLGKNYKTFAKPYLALNIESKAKMLIPLVSNFKFVFNFDNEKVKFLFKLFRLRNRLVHQQVHVSPVLIIKESNKFWINEEDDESDPEYSHAHSEWTALRRSDLNRIQSALNYWVSWLHNIDHRINLQKFNPQTILDFVSNT